MKKVVIFTLSILAAIVALYVGLVYFYASGSPIRTGAVPGTVKANYERRLEMGQRVETSGMVLAVRSASQDDAPARRSRVPEGKSLLLVDVTIENSRADESLFYSPFFAVLFEGSKPGRYRAELVDAGDQVLRSGHLVHGEETQGAIVFEVPDGAQPSLFRYGEGIYTNSTGFPVFVPISVRLR